MGARVRVVASAWSVPLLEKSPEPSSPGRYATKVVEPSGPIEGKEKESIVSPRKPGIAVEVSAILTISAAQQTKEMIKHSSFML